VTKFCLKARQVFGHQGYASEDELSL